MDGSWRRYQRDKHIKRRKRIAKDVYLTDNYYNCDGKYDTAKIHCSCGMCMCKTRNKGYKRRHIHGNYWPSINYSYRDRKRIASMDESEAEYYENK